MTPNEKWVEELSIDIGHSPLEVYTILNPSSDLSYCKPRKNELVDVTKDGKASAEAISLSKECSEDTPCTKVDLKDTTMPQKIKFKVKSYFGPNNDTFLLSKETTINVKCNLDQSKLINTYPEGH